MIEYQSQSGYENRLTLDIVDYPGEWLLDLPLLDKSYEAWSAESLRLSRKPPRDRAAAAWHSYLATLKPESVADEQAALTAARLFTEYLHACRDVNYGMSLLPPGRFLMPGELAGSPALTFAPLDLPGEGLPPPGSLWAMMRRRYDAYIDIVVRPFFRDHFARLDRQIVLVDAMAAINAGPEAVRDLEGALTAVLDCFRAGRKTFWGTLFRPQIDDILLAATKADHLHHTSHDRLEAILKMLTEPAVTKADLAGAAGRCRRACRGAGDARGHGRTRRRAAALRHRHAGRRRSRGRRNLRRRDRSGAVSGRPARRPQRPVPQ